MTMKIQDDFYEAAKQLPEDQRAAFIYAAVRYGFEGEEPCGTPPWLPVFTVIKDRIRMSREKSERGKNMANARWNKEKVPSSPCMNAEAMHEHDARSAQQHDADAMHEHDTENEGEKEIEEPPYIPPYAQACLIALNETLGTTYSALPGKAVRTLSRFDGLYTPEQVRAMIGFKQREWQGTRFARNLTPNTLFGPEHFEAYMQQSMSDSREEARYAAYDI